MEDLPTGFIQILNLSRISKAKGSLKLFLGAGNIIKGCVLSVPMLVKILKSPIMVIAHFIYVYFIYMYDNNNSTF